jgi:hypothetical protein
MWLSFVDITDFRRHVKKEYCGGYDVYSTKYGTRLHTQNKVAEAYTTRPNKEKTSKVLYCRET